MQLIIEINNWWLEPSVLPLANTLLSCEISATCNLQALQRHGGCPLHIQGLVDCFIIPNSLVTILWAVTHPQRGTANETSCILDLFPELREPRARVGLGPQSLGVLLWATWMCSAMGSNIYGPRATSHAVHSSWERHLRPLCPVATWILVQFPAF